MRKDDFEINEFIKDKWINLDAVVIDASKVTIPIYHVDYERPKIAKSFLWLFKSYSYPVIMNILEIYGAEKIKLDDTDGLKKYIIESFCFENERIIINTGFGAQFEFEGKEIAFTLNRTDSIFRHIKTSPLLAIFYEKNPI